MEIRSEVPATEFDLANERDFEFEIENHIFRIKPLSLTAYYSIEKKINLVLASLYYNSMDLRKDLAASLNIDAEHIENIRNAENLISIICRLIEPFSIFKWLKMVTKHNWYYRKRPRKWAFSLYKWFENKLSLAQIIELASWFMRYSGEYKKKIFQVLLKGIDNATRFQRAKNQDLSDFIDEDWKPGYRSVGQEMFGSLVQ